MFPITALTAALVVPIYLALSARVIIYRRTNLISLSDKGDKDLRQRIRAHANFNEYAPFILVLMGFQEAQGAPAALLYLLAAMLIFGRLLHAYAFWVHPMKMQLRFWGMFLSLSCLIISCLSLLVLSIL